MCAVVWSLNFIYRCTINLVVNDHMFKCHLQPQMQCAATSARTQCVLAAPRNINTGYFESAAQVDHTSRDSDVI